MVYYEPVSHPHSHTPEHDMTIEDIRTIARDSTNQRVDSRQHGDSRARDLMAELMLR